MSAEEKRQILKMVEEGKITADEAMTLIKAIEEAAQPEMEVYQAAPGSGSEGGAESQPVDAPEFEEVKQRARRFAQIPLWIGVGFTVVFASLMYYSLQSSGFGFWFYCLTFPFLFGVFVIAIAAGGMNSRWLFVDVRQKPGQTPGRITLGFPVPLGLVGWAFRNFGHHMQGMDEEKAAGIAEMLRATAQSNQPLIVNAQDDEDGERVMVYIG
jgi:hypothetical protein